MTKTTHLDMHEGSLLHKMKSNFCLLCQFLFNLFAQSFCKGSQLATRLPRSRATTCQNTGRAVQPARVKFKLAKSSLRFGTRSLHGPWLTPDRSTKNWTICEVFIWDTLYHNYLICPSLTSGPTSFWGTQTVL